MIKKLAILSILFLSACDRGPEPAKSEMGLASSLSSESSRVSVTKLSVFQDDLAYGNYRGIYLIKDKQTGIEFVGISGIGISEIGSHSRLVGKVNTVVSDER